MYIELHGHSNFSLLDGASHTEALVERASSLDMSALAMTDHNGLYNACRFSKAAKEAGIKPILGAELTMDGGYHITLLVEDKRGYTNLCRLITRAQLSGTKGISSLPFPALEGHTDGLICLSGCRHGEISQSLLKGEKGKALAAVEAYRSLFGPKNLYLELQNHLLPDDKKLCTQLTGLAGDTGICTVATNNVHYATREDAMLHDVLTCIKHRVILDESASFRRPNSEFYLKGPEEMDRLPWLPREAIIRTQEIGERCTFDLDFSATPFPVYPLPKGETTAGYLRRRVMERAKRRYGAITREIATRLDHELPLIERKGLSGYFLVVWDIVEYARRMGISAQGRGSAASSLVAYILGITPVDPLKHNLFVGRFLNEFGTPDIDIDIATHRREEVIRYVYEKYGRENAAMVCTHVTFQARNAIREVGKVLGLPQHVLDRMAKSVSSYGGEHVAEGLREVPEFRPYLDSLKWRHFPALCEKIADFPRHLSIHVGGMIVASRPISHIVPLEHARAEGRIVCQWDKDSVDDAGLIKLDLLGLRMLSLIDEAKELVHKHRGITIDFDGLSTDDPEVYKLIAGADTIGVFQVESRAQMQTLPKVKPQSIEDLTLEVAIVRPGPLQGNMVHPFIRRRQGKEPTVHLHPKLAPILRETLGVILFQEQILQVAMEIAGFSAGEANKLRKAMGRKNAQEELRKWHTRFLEGAKGQGINGTVSGKIFDHICGFAEFGFCKSHAASFAILCYRSAYLKRYYPAEFYCALLNNQPMGFYIPEVIIGDAKRHGVMILPLDINRSLWNCSLEDGSLRIGFRYVKGIGEDKANAILEERKKGPFPSLRALCERIRLHPHALQNLIAVGALDTIRPSRRQLLWEAGTINMAGLTGMTFETEEEVVLPEMDLTEETVIDYTVQGFSPPRHIMKVFRKALNRLGATTSGGLARSRLGETVRVGGYKVCLQMPPTAKGFAFITLEDEEGLINVVVRPDDYRKYRSVIRLEPLIFVEGLVDNKEGIVNVRANKISSLGGSGNRR
jgi:error-prone DNA polymerase